VLNERNELIDDALRSDDGDAPAAEIVMAALRCHEWKIVPANALMPGIRGKAGSLEWSPA
jgi:hypothetical protein